MSNDRWLWFGTARVEDTRRIIWICFRVAPEVFFAKVFGVLLALLPTHGPHDEEECRHTSRLGCPATMQR